MTEPTPFDALLGKQDQNTQYSLPDDIEIVLEQLEQQDSAIQDRLQHMRGNHEQRIANLNATREQRTIKLLMDQLEETNKQRIGYYHSLYSENQYLRKENRALLAQLSAITYILNHEGELKEGLSTKERILRRLGGISEFSKMFDSLVKVFCIVEFALTYLHEQNKKPPVKIIRELNSLVEETKRKRGYSRFFDTIRDARDD